MEYLRFDDKEIESYAIDILGKFYDSKYLSMIWNNGLDEFDFTNEDSSIALEVMVVISESTKKVLQYESSLKKGRNYYKPQIMNSRFDDDGNLLYYGGGSIIELKNIIKESIKEKEEKRKKRNKIFGSYELCLCVDDGGLFDKKSSFNFIIDEKILDKTEFSTLFIITSYNLFIIKNNQIKIIKLHKF